MIYVVLQQFLPRPLSWKNYRPAEKEGKTYIVVNSSKDPLRFALGTSCLKIVYTVLPEEAGQLVYETKHWFTWS